MIAAGDLEAAGDVGLAPCLDILHPSAVDAQRYFVLALASGRTGVATNALAIIDDEAVGHAVAKT